MNASTEEVQIALEECEMTEDERYERFEDEYTLIAWLQEARDFMARASNVFEECASLDEDCAVRDFEEIAYWLDEFANEHTVEVIEGIAWRIDDRSVLDDMSLDTSWWEEGGEKWHGEQVVDCE